MTISYGEQSQEQELFTFGFSLDSSALELLSPLALQADEPLRQALLRLLSLDRLPNGMQHDLPYALLRASAQSAQSADLSELYAAATVLSSSVEELRVMAEEVKKTRRLTPPEPTRAALQALKARRL